MNWEPMGQLTSSATIHQIVGLQDEERLRGKNVLVSVLLQRNSRYREI